MAQIFDYAKSFNQNIDKWNVENINKNFSLDDLDEEYKLKQYCKDNEISKMFWYDTNDYLEYKPFKNCPTQPLWLKPCEKENGKYKPKNKLQPIVLVRNKDISLKDIDISNINNLSSLFMAFDRDYAGIETWNTSHIKNMSFMFANTKNFNHDISCWNTSNVEDMSYMFYNGNKFNQDIGKWDISKVKNISYMFYSACNFNQNIGIWDISKVTNMCYIFQDAVKYSYSLNS